MVAELIELRVVSNLDEGWLLFDEDGEYDAGVDKSMVRCLLLDEKLLDWTLLAV